MISKENTRLPTGIEKLDQVLQGGIPNGSLVEILAETKSGADVLCYHLANMMIKQGKRTLWVGEDRLKVWSIRSVAQRYELEPDMVLDNIGLGRVTQWDDLMVLMDLTHGHCEDGDVGLVVINSPSPYILYDGRCPDPRYTSSGNDLIPFIADDQEDISGLRVALRDLTRRTSVTCVVVRWAVPGPSIPDRGDLWDLSFRIFQSGKNQHRIEVGNSTSSTDVYQRCIDGFYQTMGGRPDT